MSKTISLFCASQDKIDPQWIDRATQLGLFLAQNQINLAYGGAPCGLMEATAKTFSEQGGKNITAIVTASMQQEGYISRYATHRIICKNLSERKNLLIENGDFAIALPGGVGTIDEIFSWLASAQMREHSKELLLYNADHFYDLLLAHLKKAEALHFSPLGQESLIPCNTLTQLQNAIIARI